jgi:ubiquinone/menaquinone biosynthesis C-methylase UbiE
MPKSVWEGRWSEFNKAKRSSSATYPLGFVSKIGYESSKRGILKILREVKLSKDSKIIDVGCGEGRTLSYFLDYGFDNVIGIDISSSAIKVCENKGLVKNKNVFVMDAKKTKFKDNTFDLVFAEGFLEHFTDFTPFTKEFARISKKYILLTQPNHFSVTGILLNFLIPKIQKSYVKEYDYRMIDFIREFNKIGFEIKTLRGVHLGELGKDFDTGNILLFKKVKK